MSGTHRTMIKKVRTKSLLLLCAATVLTFSQSIHAADSEGHFAIKGAGLMLCEQFINERQSGSPQYYAAIGWLQGYLTAFNRFTDGVYDVLPWQNVKVLAASIDSHCGKNLKQPLFTVVRLLAASYQGQAIKERTLLVEAKVDGTGFLIYEETLRRVQARLIESGLMPGQANGRFDAETEAALRAFQRLKGLRENGLPDEATLFVLLEQSATR